MVVDKFRPRCADELMMCFLSGVCRNVAADDAHIFPTLACLVTNYTLTCCIPLGKKQALELPSSLILRVSLPQLYKLGPACNP